MLIKAVLFFSLAVAVCWSGSCKEASLCCPGRDSSCVVQKSPLNSVNQNIADKPCYCDHACVKLGDCCSDFKTACGVVDCVVSSWGSWTECSNPCGPGVTSRRRNVITAPENGGKHCPMFEQNRACHGVHCPHHIHAVMKETAMLLPVALAYSRRSDGSTLDSLNDRKDGHGNETTHQAKKDYCVKFEVIKATKSCRKEKTYQKIKDGEPICVLCEAVAMRVEDGVQFRCPGHGVDSRLTRWEGLSAPHCKGKWLRMESALMLTEEGEKEAHCSLCEEGANFIFV